MLADLHLPPHLPRGIVAIVSENENHALRVHAGELMEGAARHGFDCRVLDIKEDGWADRLAGIVQDGLLLAWGAAGVGARLTHPDGLLWDVLETPFISVMADSPCQMPRNHRILSQNVANGYVYRDWLEVQRRIIRSPQISSLLPHGVARNPLRDQMPWSARPHRMVFVKTGSDPERQRAEWTSFPRRFRAVLEETAAAALHAGVGDITPLFLACLDGHGLLLDNRPDVLFSLMYQVDQYVRDTRSTAMARALLPLPADIVGRGWDHVGEGSRGARFHPATNAATLPGLFAATQFVVNTTPNFSEGTHERVLNGFAARCCVVTNENRSMQARFAGLPSYFPVSTEAADLTDRLAELFHDGRRFDEDTGPALNLVEAEFSSEGFMRGLIELSLEVRAAKDFAGFMP